jgi:hypothetical protein
VRENESYNPLNPVVRLSGGRPRGERVAFGLALQTLFREHGITRQTDMARLIREGGYLRRIQQNTISNWILGKSEPVDPKGLADALANVLPVTAEQWDYLSLAYFAPREYMRRYHPWLVTPQGR